MTLLVEMIVDLRPRTPKELHGSFSLSKWLVRILRTIVEPAANFVTVGVADASRLAVFLHDALQKT